MKDTQSLKDALGIMPGINAIIGSGGKTTLIRALAKELSDEGNRVIVATTTKIYAPDYCPVLLGAGEKDIKEGFEECRILCVGEQATPEKLGPAQMAISELSRLADYCLIEADGSKQLPLKVHAPYEPVIPEHSVRTVLVVGTDGFYREAAKACHRFELMPELFEDGSVIVTPQLYAKVIESERLGDVIYFTKADCKERVDAALKIMELTGRKGIYAGTYPWSR